MCALFKTEEAAQIAIDRTEGYALNEGMTPSSHPLWFGHDILPVKQA